METVKQTEICTEKVRKGLNTVYLGYSCLYMLQTDQMFANKVTLHHPQRGRLQQLPQEQSFVLATVINGKCVPN